MQLPPGGQFCSRTQAWGRGSAVRDRVGEGPPPTHRESRPHPVGVTYLRGTPAEGVRAVGVGLPTPPPQQQQRLPGSIGRLRFPDSGRGGCTRPRLRGCPRRRLKGPSRCLKFDWAAKPPLPPSAQAKPKKNPQQGSILLPKPSPPSWDMLSGFSDAQDPTDPIVI